MFRTSSQFDKLLDKATSNLKLEPDWPIILQICDLIRQGDVQPKYALAAIKKKMTNPNPHVAMFSLNVLESCVKNCGSLIHDEIGTKQYMESMRETIKTMPHPNVKAKLLELIQAWAYAFRNSPKYRAVQDAVNIMKTEGYNFPALKESDAMFSADTAPGWEDGDRCNRCRVPFSLVCRKHHCRACGQVFCGMCSSKSSTLPKYGIEREVRVCDACYETANKPNSVPSAKPESDLPIEYLTSSLAQQSQAPPPRKTEAELKEEEELQLALALSQSEAEHKTKVTTSSARSTPPVSKAKSYSPPPKLSSSPETTDPDLARYLNRQYWQQQSIEFSNASAPALSATPTPPKQSSVLEQNGVEDSDMEEFVTALQTQVEIFVNRMKSDSSRGRSIANDSSVQTLFMNITAMHSKLLRYIQQQDDKRVYFEGLQDKLTQVKDARAALDALREEHRERLRREAEIAERQRHLQMAQKLDIMRKKKQEYLQYQRQLAIQRIAEQEREMQLRQEQQKQQYLMAGAQYNTLPYIRTGYEMQGRYPNPQPQSAPPFNHYPTPPGGSVDGVMPVGGGAMMMGPRTDPQQHQHQQGLMMRPGNMMAPGTGGVGVGPGGLMPSNLMGLGGLMPGGGGRGLAPQQGYLPPGPPQQGMPLGGLGGGGSQTLPRPGMPPPPQQQGMLPQQPGMPPQQPGMPPQQPGMPPQQQGMPPLPSPLNTPPSMNGPPQQAPHQPPLHPHLLQQQNLPPPSGGIMPQQQPPPVNQQQFQQPPQQQNDDKTAELISFD